MPRRSPVRAATTVGIDMGKNTLHMVGLDSLGAIVLRVEHAASKPENVVARGPTR